MKLIKKSLAVILALNGAYEITDSTEEVTKIKLAFSMFSNVEKDGLIGWIKSLSYTISTALRGFGKVTRGEAALIIMNYCEI